MTWLLTGFNERRVKDKDRLGSIVGLYNLCIGMVFLLGTFINLINLRFAMIFMVVGYMLLILYVNKNMVE